MSFGTLWDRRRKNFARKIHVHRTRADFRSWTFEFFPGCAQRGSFLTIDDTELEIGPFIIPVAKFTSLDKTENGVACIRDGRHHGLFVLCTELTSPGRAP